MVQKAYFESLKKIRRTSLLAYAKARLEAFDKGKVAYYERKISMLCAVIHCIF